MIVALVAIEWTCNLGQWAPLTGVVPAVNFTGCPYNCPPGTIGLATSLTSADGCTSCPIGQQCPEAGMSAGLDCPAGKHAPDVSTQVCLDCGLGTSTNNWVGQTSCTPCAPGFAAAGEGTATCIACKVGEYTSGNRTVACKACPSFSTTDVEGSTSIDACQCAKGFYEEVNDAESKVCSACPEGSTTSAAGSTSVDQCICQQGRYFSTDAEGTATCPNCPEGSTTSAAGSTSVNQCICQQGRFPTTNADGSTTCKQCKDVLEFSTTLEGGSSIDDCVCNQNYFLEGTATNRTCVACDAALMDCSIPGITLANMPIRPGGWRLSNTTSTVHKCFNPDACVGNPGMLGSNATQIRRRLSVGDSVSTAGDALCAPGHTGFLCGTCFDNWYVCPRPGTILVSTLQGLGGNILMAHSSS